MGYVWDAAIIGKKAMPPAWVTGAWLFPMVSLLLFSGFMQNRLLDSSGGLGFFFMVYKFAF